MLTALGASATFRGSFGGLVVAATCAPPEVCPCPAAAYGLNADADRQTPTTAAAVKNCHAPLKLLRVFIAHTSALRLMSGMSLRGETLSM
jgi:hypothetical protein